MTPTSGITDPNQSQRSANDARQEGPHPHMADVRKLPGRTNRYNI